MNVAAENTNYKYFAGALQMRFFTLPFLGFFFKSYSSALYLGHTIYECVYSTT